jgi:hypothetical protein
MLEVLSSLLGSFGHNSVCPTSKGRNFLRPSTYKVRPFLFYCVG